jgi:hypothetical protein
MWDTGVVIPPYVIFPYYNLDIFPKMFANLWNGPNYR